MNRREIISLATLMGLSVKTNLVALPNTDRVSLSEPRYYGLIDHKLPLPLKQGSTVAFTAPASPAGVGEVRIAAKYFEKIGCKTIIGQTAAKPNYSYRYFSESEDFRANEFMDLIRNTDIDAIVCARGGYGVMRILEKIDYDEIARNPKIIMGFSDITALLNAVYKLSKVVTYHGPVAASTFTNYTIEKMQEVLFASKALPIVVQAKNPVVINGGVAKGKLVGGNLRMVISAMGTPYEPDMQGAILFLEEVSEHPYQIDRMLTQLRMSGKLAQTKGIVFGIFDDLNRRKPFFPNYSFTIKEVIQQIIEPLGVPCFIGLPFGHVKDKATLPIGIKAEIDADKGTLYILEQPVML